jgi:hypothetical protein
MLICQKLTVDSASNLVHMISERISLDVQIQQSLAFYSRDGIKNKADLRAGGGGGAYLDLKSARHRRKSYRTANWCVISLLGSLVSILHTIQSF